MQKNPGDNIQVRAALGGTLRWGEGEILQGEYTPWLNLAYDDFKRYIAKVRTFGRRDDGARCDEG